MCALLVTNSVVVEVGWDAVFDKNKPKKGATPWFLVPPPLFGWI